MYQTKTTLRVRYAETDQMGVVYYGNYAQYFEVGRVESIRQLGYTYKAMEDMGIIMPVVEMNIKYLRSAVYDDLLTIQSTIKEIPTEHRIEYHQEVYNESGKLLAIGTVALYFLDAVSKQKVLMPSHLANALQPFF